MATFKENYEYGKVGESLVAKWLRKRGNHIMPVYEKVIEGEFRGPAIFPHVGKPFAAPDMFVFTKTTAMWVESKRKGLMTFRDVSRTWQVGIKMKDFNNYLNLIKMSPFQVWIFFLVTGGHDEYNRLSPGGLYCENLANLLETFDHYDYEESDMIYWNDEDLRKFDTYESVSNL